VLEILVRAVVDNLTDHRGEQSSNLKAKLQELFAQTPKYGSSTLIYMAMAKATV
ncbi:hypothetical protein M9458_034518, partial [Cirrhinus mrigala]